MMNEPTDHYDGNPDSKYEDEVRKFMEHQIFAFEKTSTSFNSQRLMTDQADLWMQKFPNASIRWGETVAAYNAPTEREKFHSVEINPKLLDNRRDHVRVALGNVKTKGTVTGLHNQPKPVKSKDRLIARQQQLESDKLKLFLGEADFRQSTTMTAYDQFTRVIQHFRINGGSFKTPPKIIAKMAELIKDVNSIPDMQRWLVSNQGKTDFNAFHEEWTKTPLMNKRMGHSDRVRRTDDMLTCLEYHNFIQIRTKVSWKFFPKTCFCLICLKTVGKCYQKTNLFLAQRKYDVPRVRRK